MKIFEQSLGRVSIHPEGDWKTDTKYEKLALVYCSVSNASYIAKKDVPENISPLSDEDEQYWFKLGNNIDISINPETNTWLINNIDTGIVAKGDKGDPGDLSNAVGIGFSHDILYNPSDRYNNHILIKQSDNTDAAAEFPTKELKSEDDYNYYLITAKLKNEVVQKETILNAFFPIAIAGRMYNNMVSGNCLPIYYASGLEVNPFTGIIRISNVSIKDPDNPISYVSITDLLERYFANIEKGTGINSIQQKETSAVASGTASVAVGQQTTASGEYSYTEGYFTTASGDFAHSEGEDTVASGQSSHAEGNGSQATGDHSHAEGYGASANGDYSHAEGEDTYANGLMSHAEGDHSKASGEASHTEGSETIAVGGYSHVEGIGENVDLGFKPIFEASTSRGYRYRTSNGAAHLLRIGDIIDDDATVTYVESSSSTKFTVDKQIDTNTNVYRKFGHSAGSAGHSEGKSITIGNISHSEGNLTVAIGNNSHSEGKETQAWGNNSHAEGNYTYSLGVTSHAEGYKSKTGGDSTQNNLIKGDSTESGAYAHAEGNANVAVGVGSHVEGEKTFASGVASHAEGSGTEAFQGSAHAEGTNTHARGTASHTEGLGTEAGNSSGSYPGNCAHAEGLNTKAYGNCSHTEGSGTETSNEAEHAEGLYNKSNTGTRHSVGIGTSTNNRKNAFEVMQNGEIYICGVGGYDGTNPTTNVNSLQKVLEGLGVTIDWTKLGY